MYLKIFMLALLIAFVLVSGIATTAFAKSHNNNSGSSNNSTNSDNTSSNSSSSDDNVTIVSDPFGRCGERMCTATPVEPINSPTADDDDNSTAATKEDTHHDHNGDDISSSSISSSNNNSGWMYGWLQFQDVIN